MKNHTQRLQLACLALALALAGCGGDGGTDGGTDPSTQSYPADSSEEGIAAYLASGAYTEAPWISETDVPRERSSEVSPHGTVRVWANDILVASQAAPDAGSMVVKDMFDGTDAIVATAVMLKLETGEDWAYYCEGLADRCGVSGTTPVWGVGLDTDCGFCHGGTVFNAF